MTRTITALFDSRAAADQAQELLVAAGVGRENISVYDQTNLDRGTTTGSANHGKGIWESIKSLFGDDDRVYEEGLRRGGYLLTAEVDEQRADDVIDILDNEGTVDTEARAGEWRSAGWTGGSTAGAYDDDVDADRDRYAGTDTGGEQRIPVVEERLRVGKRETSRGGVRVRSYIVEEPVHEQVSLREEHVNVERRPATGNASDADFRERSFEVSETAEEAVISKDAVVREEVVVSKTSEERVQSIDDTVRRTEVDVERTGGERSGATRGDDEYERTHRL